jgi:hypothetical protein
MIQRGAKVIVLDDALLFGVLMALRSAGLAR